LCFVARFFFFSLRLCGFFSAANLSGNSLTPFPIRVTSSKSRIGVCSRLRNQIEAFVLRPRKRFGKKQKRKKKAAQTIWKKVEIWNAGKKNVWRDRCGRFQFERFQKTSTLRGKTAQISKLMSLFAAGRALVVINCEKQEHYETRPGRKQFAKKRLGESRPLHGSN